MDEAVLAQVSDILKIPVEAIQDFDEEHAVNLISNTFTCTDSKGNASVMNFHPVFDPVDKLIKLHEELHLNTMIL